MKSSNYVWKLILLIFIWSSNSCFAIETNFLDPSDHSKTSLTSQSERLVGEKIMQKIHGTDFLIPDPVVNEYLGQLAKKFGSKVNITDFKLHFFGVDTPEFNAFAFFGGHVAVHSGLILAVGNESELAAVLAHETAHISQRHLARTVAANKQMMPLTYAEILAAIAIGALASPEAGAHLITAAMAGHVQQMINFTRDHEKEADRIGIKLLADSNYDPNAMITVFERMKKRTRYHEMPPEYLMTHPVFDSRISDAQHRAAAFPKPTNLTDSLQFHLVRARLEVGKEENTTRKINRLKAELQSNPNKIAAQYGYALALLKNRKANLALPILKELVAKHPEQWILELALSEALEVDGQIEAALIQSKRLLQSHPGNSAIILHTADLYLKNNQAQETLNLLFPYRKTADYPVIHQMMARAYSKTKQPALVHRSQAEWHLIRGEFKAAYKQLDLALEYASQNSQIAMQIKERKNTIKKLEKNQDAVKL